MDMYSPVYIIETMKLKMMKCPKCGEKMPVKRKQLGYNVCINCSTESAKRGIPVMRGTGDHTWVDLEVMTQEQYDQYEELNTSPSKRTKNKPELPDLEKERKNLKGPFKIIEEDEE
jgi:ribosomal protein L37AE/L43A